MIQQRFHGGDRTTRNAARGRGTRAGAQVSSTVFGCKICRTVTTPVIREPARRDIAGSA
jgi:hypothetical protein